MNDLVQEVTQDAEFSRRYELTGRLGEGGMGTVHRGTHRLLGRPVAIKFMRPEFVTEEIPRQRFLSEARTAAGLIHPNVCVVLDFGFAGRVPFLVTELVEGTSLQNLILKSPSGMLEPSLVLAVTNQMLDGLEAIHALGVVHRDLKPANVVVTKDNRAKILDFGLAKPYHNQSQSGATLPGTVVGTPAYISPEQGTAGKLSPASDLYSLAVMFYELVIGQLPFRSENSQDVIKMHVYDAPVVPDHLLTPVRHLLTRGLTKRPRDRYQSAAEFRADLDAVEAAVKLSHGFARPPTAPLVEPPTDPGAIDLIPRQSPTNVAPRPDQAPTPAAPAPALVAPISRPVAGENTMQALAVPPKRPWPFLEIGVGAVVLVAGLWLTAPQAPPVTPASPTRSPSAANAPRTFFAQADLLRRNVAENDWSGFNEGVVALRAFQARPPDPSESAALDEILLAGLELACRQPPPASHDAGDYSGLLGSLSHALKAQRLMEIAETLHRARWAELPPGNALDFLRGAALIGTAQLPDPAREGVGLLERCMETHRGQFLGAWAGDLLAEVHTAAADPSAAERCRAATMAPSADDRHPALVQFRRSVKFLITTQLARGGRNRLLERALK